MILIDAYKKVVLANYANFNGRADRPEFWYFQLTYFLMSLVVSFVDGLLGATGILTILLVLGHLIPSLAVGARRLHDTDRSGWWQLISLIPLVGFIVLIVFFCLTGISGANRFGSDPKGG